MTDSRRVRDASSYLPAPAAASNFSSTLVGWLIQTAFIAVVEETCESFAARQALQHRNSGSAATRLAFPLRLYQDSWLPRVRDRKAK